MKCWTRDCEKETAKGQRYCYACRKRKYREKYPLKYWYDTLKMNAKRRGKSFTLTLKEFETFCKKTGYDDKKGKTANSLSVDRIKNEQGYSFDNIQAITLSENTVKRNTEDYLRTEIGDAPF
jgi:hypothetical protein